VKTKKPLLSDEKIQEALDCLELTIVEEGSMLPTKTQLLSDDDLLLYGRGSAVGLEQLKEIVGGIERREERLEPKSSEVFESLAMAARNGDHIDKKVWDNMRADRLKSEKDADFEG